MAQISLTGYVSSEFETIKFGGLNFVACIITAEKGRLVVPVYFDYYLTKLIKKQGVKKGYLLNLTLSLKTEVVVTTKGEKKVRTSFECIDFEIIADTVTKIQSTDYLSKLLILESMTHVKREIKEEKKNGK